MKEIRIGGVPEHFNLPWLLALEKDSFKNEGIDLKWSFFPGGTGAMNNALKYDELDLAIILTEGFIAAVSNGLEAKAVKTYIDTPLLWGIFTSSDSEITDLSKRSEAKFAISRIGSGSHLMPLIHANENDITLKENQFVIIDDLKNAIVSLSRKETQYFYWEKFTTKPFVDNGTLKLIATYSAPWSSFLLVASSKCLNQNNEVIEKIIEVINKETKDIHKSETFKKEVSNRFQMSIDEVNEWISNVRWNSGKEVDENSILKSYKSLLKLGLTKERTDIKNLLF